MKKYFNIVLLISVFSIFLVLQVGFDLVDLSANTTATEHQKLKHYSNNIKKVVLTDLLGRRHDLAAEKAPIVLTFWASWCQPCLTELPWLENLRADFSQDELFIAAINVDDKENPQKLNKIIKNLDLNFPIIIDEDNVLASQFLVDSVPTTMVFVNGKVVAMFSDISDFNEGIFRKKILSAIDL